MLFTFQYVPICFYYFSFYDTITDFVSKIYIPICFYYFSAVPEGSAVYGNLHSNMFLLFLCSHFSRSTFNHIYIPICFYYFTISPSERYNSDMHLHSNMFLLFRITNSIYATYNHNLHSNMFLLFQLLVEQGYTDFENLHSNMFLLFLTSNLIKSLLDFIYIPICFYYFESVRKIQRHSFIIYIPICFYYFEQKGYKSKRRIKVFTFQYVSIISRRRFCSC